MSQATAKAIQWGRDATSLLTLLLSLVLAESLIGVASAIDGDTLEIHGERIRLHGIDVPESGQLCRKPDGALWRCGQKAAFALADRVGGR